MQVPPYMRLNSILKRKGASPQRVPGAVVIVTPLGVFFADFLARARKPVAYGETTFVTARQTGICFHYNRHQGKIKAAIVNKFFSLAFCGDGMVKLHRYNNRYGGGPYGKEKEILDLAAA